MTNDYLFTLALDGSRNAAVMENLDFWAEIEGIGEVNINLADRFCEDVEELEEEINGEFNDILDARGLGPLAKPFRIGDFEALDPAGSDTYRYRAVELLNGLLEKLYNADDDYMLEERVNALVEVYGLDVLLGDVDLNGVEFYPDTNMRDYVEELVNDCYDLGKFEKELGNLAFYLTFDYDMLARDMMIMDGYSEARGGVLYAPEM